MENVKNNKKTTIVVVISVVAALVIAFLALLVWFLVDSFVRNEPPARDVYVFEDYEYVVLPDETIEIVEYIGSDMQVTVPSAIDGKLVTSIGDYAFFESSVQGVTMGSFVKSIGAHSFASSGSLASVTLSSGLVSIGDYAFRLCQSIKKIELPSGLAKIGEGAFYGTEIESVELPLNISEVPKHAFSNCFSLKEVTLPASVKAVGDSAFFDCSSLESVTLPAVESIGGYAFGSCTSLTTVTLGADIREISSYAFQYCSALKSVTVPGAATCFEVVDGLLIDKVNKRAVLLPAASGVESLVIPEYVEHIAPYAISGVEGLVSVTIPSGLKTVGESAFSGSKQILRFAMANTPDDVAFAMPDTITDVGGFAFAGCQFYSNLFDEFTIVGDGILVKYTPVTDAYGAWIDTEHSTVIREDRVESGVTIPNVPVGVSVRIPEGVKKMSSAFANANAVLAVTTPKSLTEISLGAFSYAAFLEKLDFSESPITHIGDRAFEACQSLKDVTLPTTLKTVGDYLFFSCYALESITIPPVEVLGGYMFADCTALKTVNISEGTTTIGQRAFHKNYKLATITLPDSIKLIKEYAFSESGLVEFTLKRGVEAEGYILFNCVKLRNLTIEGEGVTPVGIAFGCTVLDKVVISDGFYRIGEESFYDCQLLKTVVIPDSVTEIGGEAFAHCSALKSIEFGGDLTYIGAYAFNLARRLQTFEFDKTLTTIGDYAFSGCENLDNIDLRWITTLGEHCFENCFKLTHVDLRSVAYAIPEGAFSYCTALSDIRFADTVTEIGTAAFLNNTALTTVTFPSSLIQVGENAFMGSKNLSQVGWNDGLIMVDHGAFYDTGLVDVVLPESVEMIGDATFASCQKLRTFKMGNNVTYLGEAAFMLSSGLYDVTISSALDTIALETFAYTGLVAVAIPEGVKTIDEAAFASCTYLARIDLAKSVRTVCDSAFENCKAIKIVSYYGEPILIGGIDIGTNNEYFINALLVN